MKTLTIESANKLRNKYLLWIIVTFPFVYFPLVYLPAGKIATGILMGIFLVSMVWMFITIFRMMRLNKRIKESPEISRALSGEIFLVYQRKALYIGFFTVIGLLAIIVPLSRVVTLRTDIVCMSLFIVGIISYVSSWLIYNRE